MNLARLFALGSIASLAPLVEFTARFGRTIILSRSLSPTEFGIGAALTVLMGIAELSSDLALDRFLILRAKADDGEALAAAHQLSVARGAVVSILVFVAAPWVAGFLGAPGQEWSFRAVAGVVLLHSCAHLEMKQMQRDFRYAPDAMAYVIAHSAVLAVVYPAARLLGDHRAVLVILFVECGVYVAVSHAVARHRYSLVSKRRDLRREALLYGLPLSLNGLGLAVMSQLDRALVSHWFGVERLAFYAIILNMTVIPISAIYRVLGQLGMSFLARRHADSSGTANLNIALVWAYSVVAGGYALFVAATLDFLAPLIFGAVYSVPPIIHALITVVVWIRVCRGAQTLIMLSCGDTARLMISNLVAACWVVFAAVALPLWPSLETMLACVLVGDIISQATFVWETRGRMGGHLRGVIGQLVWSCGAMTAGLVGIWSPDLGGITTKFILLAASLVMLLLQLGYGGWRHLLSARSAAESISAPPVPARILVDTKGAKDS